MFIFVVYFLKLKLFVCEMCKNFIGNGDFFYCKN